jgi:FlaA1/EpsC-like NDP-sugar epimerase
MTTNDGNSTVVSGNWGRRRFIQAMWDGLSWLIAMPIAATLRYDFAPSSQVLMMSLLIGLGCAALQIATGSLFHLYRGRYIVGSFDEVFGVGLTTLFTGIAGTIVVILLPQTEFPRSTVVIATGLAGASMLGARFAWRRKRQLGALGRTGSRTLIYGAGDAGSQVANLLLTDSTGEFQPIGFIDDDPTKQHLRRAGLKVLGNQDSLESLIREYEIDTLLVAIAGITAERLLGLDRRCKPLNVKVRIIPTASEIAGGAVKLGDISDVTEEDLMGRRPIHTDEVQIRNFIVGKRVLVTGAGGSIGSELVRQLTRYQPESVVLLDRDESALHSAQLTLDGTGTLTSENLILADIRDYERIVQVFQEVKPQIVFHAAALKHLPLLERFPDEAYKTNVIGTLNVLNAAKQSGVSTFVNISTDKAADPASVLGYSKLITEKLTAGVEAPSQGKFVSVRFGNVLGSRGSVLHTFRYQIANGGPVTVTDEEVTRFFMTVSEAVHLVLQASVLAIHGQTLILDMGKPVKIADVARYMIEHSGRNIELVFTGLRTGEKLHENLISSSETLLSPSHPLISHTRVIPIRLDISSASQISDAREFMRGLSA